METEAVEEKGSNHILLYIVIIVAFMLLALGLGLLYFHFKFGTINYPKQPPPT